MGPAPSDETKDDFRPVEITLERSWRALSLEEKSAGIKLLVDALVGRGNSTELMEQKRAVMIEMLGTPV